jgi:hypothetical protein
MEKIMSENSDIDKDKLLGLIYLSLAFFHESSQQDDAIFCEKMSIDKKFFKDTMYPLLGDVKIQLDQDLRFSEDAYIKLYKRQEAKIKRNMK